MIEKGKNWSRKNIKLNIIIAGNHEIIVLTIKF